MKKQKSLRELARELEVSPSYLSMILSGQRKASQKFVDKLQSIPGVHKVVNNYVWKEPSKQGVLGSSPSRDARYKMNQLKNLTERG
ncbi:helix-turn-helix domain-containing protein [Chloroflexota bacterium]